MHFNKSDIFGSHNWKWWWQIPWWEWKVGFYATFKSGNLHFCIYYWCLSQRRIHNLTLHLKHKAVSTLKLSHPSLTGPSPVDSEEPWSKYVLHDKILYQWTVVHQEVTSKSRLEARFGPCLPEHSRYGPCQHRQLFPRSTKVSVISVSPCCRETHKTKEAALNIILFLLSTKIG